MQINQINLQKTPWASDFANLEQPVERLFMLGSLPKSRPLVAFVGTRSCTPYGVAVTRLLAGELAHAGYGIVSGLAYGIDVAAHEAALDAGGLTIAVMAGGLDRVYPADHWPVAKRITGSGGVLISEYPAGTPEQPFRFLERNRIIAAVAAAVVVVESGARGGSLNTASHAEKLSKPVLAVPGPITSVASAGTIGLIRDGKAQLVRNSSDIIAALGLGGLSAPLSRKVTAHSPQEAAILKLLGGGAMSTQSLIDATGLSAPDFANIISLMEITGSVRNEGAGRWGRR